MQISKCTERYDDMRVYPTMAIPTVLVVDDTPDILSLMTGLLKDQYRVKVANNGYAALKIAHSVRPPDLILLDVMMPGINGYQVCEMLKNDEDTRDIPVIFLTGKSSPEDQERGFSLGGADYIAKPISPPVVLARVKTHLQNKLAADFLKNQNSFLEKEVESRTSQLFKVQDVTIQAMASLAETRDSDTGNHIRRTQHYVLALATRLKHHPRFAHELTDNNIQMLYKSAPLHDIGKVGIPDKILLKPGRLSTDEFEIMKQHAALGRDALKNAEEMLETNVEFLEMAKQIAYAHHEKWDGSGYPEGLKGDDINIPARLMAVADVYDALISRRVYKQGMSHEEATKIIAESRNSHFDSDVVDSFLAVEDEFQSIAKRFADGDVELERKAVYLRSAM